MRSPSPYRFAELADETPEDNTDYEVLFRQSIRRHERFMHIIRSTVLFVMACVAIVFVFALVWSVTEDERKCRDRGGALLEGGQCVKVIPL